MRFGFFNNNMRFNKFSAIFCVLMFSAVATTSTGFDLYAHAVSYYFYDEIINRADIFYNRIVLPRYLLLSYVYEFGSRLGIPLGIIASFLILYPSYYLVKEVESQNTVNRKLNFQGLSILLLVFILCFFYSGLSLVILWLVAFLVTKKNIFIAGALFHPIGLIIYCFTFFVLRVGLLKLFITVLFCFVLFYLLTIQGYFTSARYDYLRYDISLGNFFELMRIVLDRKANEIFVTLFVVSVCFVARSRISKYAYFFRGIYIRRSMVVLLIVFILTGFNFYFCNKGRHTLFLDMSLFEISDPVYATWFDWGEKDLPDNHSELYSKRYE